MFIPSTRILICDDMPTIRDMVGGELRRLGFSKQVTAADGSQAWNLFVESFPTDPIGLIISDWNMPVMTGLEFLKNVRAHSEGNATPFVLLTAESEKEQIVEAISYGVTQYILKPFSAKSFEEKLRSAWQKVSTTKPT